MVDSTQGIELLLDAGLERRVTGSAEVEVRAEHGVWSRWAVNVLGHSPSPAEVERALDLARKRALDGTLFVVDRAGANLRSTACEDPRVSYAALTDRLVWLAGHEYRAPDDGSKPVAKRNRVSWVQFGILRLFALTDRKVPLAQSEIARRLGVSHVAVGKQLPALDAVVERTNAGWAAFDRALCWDRFLATYPGPHGLATYWTARMEPDDQLRRLSQACSLDPTDLPIISGDAAADQYAPWRRPTRLTAYVTQQPALERLGFASVRAGDATVEVRIPKDPTIRATASPQRTAAELRYADPLITAWDVARTRGGDVPDAVEQIRTRALKGDWWN